MRSKPSSITASAKLIDAVTTPLGFFGLALVILESLVVSALAVGDLPSKEKMILMYLGVGLFVLIVLIVAILVWCKPRHLTFDKDAHVSCRDQHE